MGQFVDVRPIHRGLSSWIVRAVRVADGQGTVLKVPPRTEADDVARRRRPSSAISNALRRALEGLWSRAAPGPRHLALVVGSAGAGKTTLGLALQVEVAAARGLFALGKFEELSGRVPFFGIAAALPELTRQVLGSSEATLSRLRVELAERLGPVGDRATIFASASRFYRRRGRGWIATTYVRAAIEAFGHWGALEVVRVYEEAWGSSSGRFEIAHLTSQPSNTSSTLDHRLRGRGAASAGLRKGSRPAMKHRGQRAPRWVIDAVVSEGDPSDSGFVTLRVWDDRGLETTESGPFTGGPGLDMVRRIGSRHGGRTWVDLTPSGGARFNFSLPGARSR